jgi:putative membrane protein insertion efficiency factor
MTRLALGLIKLYQNTVSEVLPHACRFQPTCSHYAVEAIKKYGFFRGSWLATRRIIRCNPFSEGGYDPVP